MYLKIEILSGKYKFGKIFDTEIRFAKAHCKINNTIGKPGQQLKLQLLNLKTTNFESF